MTRARALVALAASVALLAGCTTPPPLPAPLTAAEKADLAAQNRADWWNSMFPDEPQPAIEPVAYLTADSDGTQIMQCMKDQHIEGMVFSENSWTYASTAPYGQDLANRAMFVCDAQYPMDPSLVGYLSDAEMEWNYNYNQKRLVPCLHLMGYTVANRTGEYAKGSNDYWVPYYEMTPMPTAQEWKIVDLKCPPSPVGSDLLYRPTNG